MKKVIFILVCILLFVGCQHKIDRGVVVEKLHSPSRTTYTYIKVGNVFCPMPITQPESWSIRVEDNGIREVFNIDSHEWETLHIGDSVVISKKNK